MKLDNALEFLADAGWDSRVVGCYAQPKHTPKSYLFITYDGTDFLDATGNPVMRDSWVQDYDEWEVVVF